jgi:type VI secretion system protein ImpL
VQAARAALRDIPLAQRVHDRLMQRMSVAAGGPQGLAELAGPAAPLVFMAGTGRGTRDTIAAPYTRDAWQRHIDPAVDATIAELADEAVWVLGDSGVAADRLRFDAAARDDIAAQVGRRHAQAVIAQWDAFLGGLRLRPATDADTLARMAAHLSGPDSPLRQLLRRLQLEFPAASHAAASASASTATSALDATLRARYAPLVEYATSGASGIDRVLEALAAFVRDGSTTPGADLARDLRAEAARGPAALRQLWEPLADSVAAMPPRAAAAAIAESGAIGTLAHTCRELIGERFPFAPDAKRDMPRADFARLFGPEGLLDEFFRAHVAAQVDTRSRPWRLTSDTGDARKRSLRSFEMADDIRRLFFPDGARQPQLQLRMTPVGMDTELLQFSIDVDGQLLRYENGPSRPKVLQWPGPAATERVLMRILPPGPSDIGTVSHEGPWALLRVLPTSSWQAGAAGAAPRVRLQVDGRALALEVATDAKASPSLIAELPQFRCPEVW